MAKRPMTRVGRAVEKGETQGFMKIAVDAETGAILGAAILGTGGDEVIHSILDVMYAKAPWTVIRRAMHIHPTVSELVPTMLSEPPTDGLATPEPSRHSRVEERNSSGAVGPHPRSGIPVIPFSTASAAGTVASPPPAGRAPSPRGTRSRWRP